MFLVMATDMCFCIGLATSQKITRCRKWVRQVDQAAGNGQKDFRRASVCGQEAHPGVVTTGNPTKALKVAEPWEGVVQTVERPGILN